MLKKYFYNLEFHCDPCDEFGDDFKHTDLYYYIYYMDEELKEEIGDLEKETNYQKEKYECLGKHGMLNRTEQDKYNEERRKIEHEENKKFKKDLEWLLRNE